jgi:hypothetical protein
MTDLTYIYMTESMEREVGENKEKSERRKRRRNESTLTILTKNVLVIYIIASCLSMSICQVEVWRVPFSHIYCEEDKMCLNEQGPGFPRSRPDYSMITKCTADLTKPKIDHSTLHYYQVFLTMIRPSQKHQDSCSSCSDSIRVSDLHAVRLLDTVLDVLDRHIKKEQELTGSIVEQMVLVTALHSTGSSFGNKMCIMNKLARIRHEREKVSAAIKVLDAQAEQIESALDIARNQAMGLEGDWGNASIDNSLMGIKINLTLTQEIDEILSGSSSLFLNY